MNAETSHTINNWEEMWRLSKHKWFRHPLFQERIASILKHWLSGKTVADIGCGTGDYLSRLKGSCNVIGVDISIEALRIAHGRRVLASGEALPFKTGALEGVFSIGTFHCLPRPELMLREVKRALAPGGILVLVVPSATSLPALIERHCEGLLRIVCRLFENDQIPEIHRTFKTDSLMKLMREEGFEPIAHDRQHIGYTFRSALIRLPLLLVERLGFRNLAEEIVGVYRSSFPPEMP